MIRILQASLLLALLMPVAAADDFLYHGSFLWNDIRGVAERDDFLFCAFHDGIGAVDLTVGFNKKKLHSTVELDQPSLYLYIFDDLLVSWHESGSLSLVDIANPVAMIHLGSFDPELELYDLERIGNYLYAAMEYDGVFRYDISDPDNIRFDDSSMVGISVTRLLVYESRLYALDVYNGILVYEPDLDGFGEPISELLLPMQAVSFTIANDTVYAGVGPNGYMVASVANPLDPEYLGFRESFIRGDHITVTPNGLVLSNSLSGFELIYGSGEDQIDQLFPVTGVHGYPDVFEFNGNNYIVYSHGRLGFTAYDIDDPYMISLEYPNFVYASPGPITQLMFINSRLHVVGTHNWYEIFDVSIPGNPERSGKMINPPFMPAGVCTKADTMFVADIQTNSFFPAVDGGSGDPEHIPTIFSVTDSIARPYIIPDYFSDGDLLYFHNDHYFNGSARNDTSVSPNRIRWDFPTGVTAMAINGNTVYQANSKNMLFIHTIDEDYLLTDEILSDITGRINHMMVVDTLLYLASAGLMTANIADPLAPVLINTVDDIGTVYEMQLIDPWLICAANSGIHIFDISDGVPQTLFSGGSRAALVAFDDYTLAASDSHSVKLYTVPIADTEEDHPIPQRKNIPLISGYPNPFNPTITLVLENFRSRSEPVLIDIYDILGRRIRQLSVARPDKGRSELIWDGRDENGRPAASGIYLFRAGNDNEKAVFKAILLK